jgi:hypothetical protein
MNINSLSASALSQYAASMLANPKGTGDTEEASATAAPLDLGSVDMKAKLAESRHDVRTQLAQQKLDQQQTALSKELLAGLKQQGVSLSAEISFSVDKNGAVSVTGKPEDVAKVQAYLKGDATRPSLHDRLGDVLQSAQALSAVAQQSNAISMAARYAGSSSDVMALYSQFMSFEDSASSKLTLSLGGESALNYAGMMRSQA